MAGAVHFTCDRCGEALPVGEAPASALVRDQAGAVVANADLCPACALLVERFIDGAPAPLERGWNEPMHGDQADALYPPQEAPR